MMSALTKTEMRSRTAVERTEVLSSETIPHFFARGMNRYKLFWVCIITSFLGCIAETVFMLLTRGELQNRSGVLYGSFSLVWGLGATLFTLCLHRLSGKNRVWIFLVGSAMGAVYEYACSWMQEVLFGACFWDYSHLPLHINGRVNLIFSAFWGLAAVLWVKSLYPAVCRLIGRIPNGMGKPLTIALAALMCVNVTLTTASLCRMDQRQKDVPAGNGIARFLDQHYPDQRLYRTFSTLKYVGTDEARNAAGMGRVVDIPQRK